MPLLRLICVSCDKAFFGLHEDWKSCSSCLRSGTARKVTAINNAVAAYRSAVNADPRETEERLRASLSDAGASSAEVEKLLGSLFAGEGERY